MLGLLYFILPQFDYSFDSLLLEYWGFSFILTLFSFFIVLYIHHQNPNRTGFAFLGLVLVKMAVSAIYIIPQLKVEGVDKYYLMFNFFGAYFFLLFLEARELMVLLKEATFEEKDN
jgi:hypothetical protein